MNSELGKIFINEGSKRYSDLNFLQWCERNIRFRVSGNVISFSLIGHEPLKEIYENPEHPDTSHQKPAQIGVSAQEIAKTFYFADKYSIKAGYYLSDDEATEKYVQGRVDTLIRDSEYLSTAIANSEGADSTAIKQMGKSTIYFRGLYTLKNVKSIDLDILIIDEFDEGNQENTQFAEDRLFHSLFNIKSRLSQASIEDFGINAFFKQSDMRHWGCKCSSCNHWNFPDETFPECLMTRGETVYIGCIKCTKKLNIPGGIWVPKFPDRSKFYRGYQHSHLIYQIMPPAIIKQKYEKADTLIKKKNFAISILGKPPVTSKNKPITLDVIKKAENNYPVESNSPFSFFGMDVGDVCHIVFLKPFNGRLRLIWFQDISSDDEEAIKKLIKKMGAYCGVIDAMPYKTLAKNVARSMPGQIHINYYKGDTLNQSEEGQGIFAVPKVTVDRDESLDETCDAIKTGKIEFPDPKMMEPNVLKNYESVKSQLQMLFKVPEENRHGIIEYHYKKKVPNHYGMAMNYARIASEISRMNIVSGVQPVFIKLN